MQKFNIDFLMLSNQRRTHEDLHAKNYKHINLERSACSEAETRVRKINKTIGNTHTYTLTQCKYFLQGLNLAHLYFHNVVRI